MKVVITPDSFKGSLTAIEVAEAIEKGVKSVFYDAETIKIPLADGGEGTVQCLVNATDGKILQQEVINPLGKKINASYGILGDQKTAVIEMAEASGITLISPEERNPLITTTYGTGQLIREALNQGCCRMIIGIGGSATNDGGAGLVQALGVRLLNKEDKEIGFGGAELLNIHHIDIAQMDPRIDKLEILVASDVKNPLCGPTGATRIYGPQKGATEKMMVILEKALAHFAELINETLHKDVKDIPGAGAAGGLGAGLMAFLGARLKPGIEVIIEAVKLEEVVKNADLVITGEGKIDYQTIYGKVPVGVAKVAKKYHIPVMAIGAIIEKDAEIVHQYGIDYLVKVSDPPMRLTESKEFKLHLIKNCINRFLNNHWN